MNVKKLITFCLWLPSILMAENIPEQAKELDWVIEGHHYCGGYYLEPVFISYTPIREQAVHITGHQGFLSQRSTSILEKVSIVRDNQKITANKAYIYRNKESGKLKTVKMVGNVHLREPDTLVIANQAFYDLETKHKTLFDILYRTQLQDKKIPRNKNLVKKEVLHPRKITAPTAWGKAAAFTQTQPLIYQLQKATFTTCPPIDPAWYLKSDYIQLNKNTGRGYATQALIYIKNMPVFYVPYINFPIDKRRKSGVLTPTFGMSKDLGTYVWLPIYFNLAPNYDTIFTPGILSARGTQWSDQFRYLTTTNSGKLAFSILPNDRGFKAYKKELEEDYQYNADPVIQAELQHILNNSNTRKAFFWRDKGFYNEHLTTLIDFNYAGDDYYLRDFGNNLNEITLNQLLQEAIVNYKTEHWNFLGRLQSYQTLHPIVLNEPPVLNQYRRLPQLILTADYPNQPFNSELFINTEMTHFEILKTPGTEKEMPTGNRYHIQPGISFPFQHPYFYLIPRVQLAMTQYELKKIGNQSKSHYHRSIPIIDLASGLKLSRHLSLFQKNFRQTLEPEIYYTYIPYRNQADIPVFDTTVRTLTYDELFQYNRFTGLDRIGDTQQISVGTTMRFIDQFSGLEKIRLGLGEIFYFKKRKVTLCNDDSCTDNPSNPDLARPYSPLSAQLNYQVNKAWQFTGNVIWNPLTKQIDNSTLSFHYEPVPLKILNLGFSYAKKGNAFSGLTVNSRNNYLKILDISFIFPLKEHVNFIGQWSQDLSQKHFQNLLFGLQYDSCCWTLQLGGGKTFSNLSPENKPTYNPQFFLQFSLKGLGHLGTGNPSKLLSRIAGYRQENLNE